MPQRIFTSFAKEDAYARDFLVQQARDERSPFEFIDMSVKEPWDNAWKTQCRTKIKGCDSLIALISKRTYNADGARWEIKCADEEDLPILGVHIHKDDKGAVPPELRGHKVIEWSWNGIASFINSL
jgi:hypothetical protein